MKETRAIYSEASTVEACTAPSLRALPPVVLPLRTMFKGFFLLLKNVTWSLHSTAILKRGRDIQLSNLENNHPFLIQL